MATHLVVGAGAVGLGIGTSLLEAGEQVVYLARGDTARALRARGCSRGGLFGELAFPPGAFAVVESAAELDAPPDVVLVATKSFASEAIASDLAGAPPVAKGDAPIVLAQNGLGNAERFVAHFPEARIWNARVITGFRRPRPEHVEVTVHADTVLLGSIYGEDPKQLAPLADAISQGGLPAAISDRIGEWLWAKLLYNCALNPLGALLGVPYGELAERDTTRRLMDRTMAEIFAVMEACGETTRWPDAEQYRSHFYDTLLPPTASHESSMLQDVRAGRRTEIDALCGEVAARGSRSGVRAPVNEALAGLIRALEP